jgi:hypothetical protein
MKYSFSIFVPHQGDELIGCRKFIEKYGQHINTVVFLTNGELNPIKFNDMPSYIIRRRSESNEWLKNKIPNVQIHYLNIPDGFGLENINNSHFGNAFEQINGKSIITHIVTKLSDIVGSDIILSPSCEKHPSHELAFSMAELLLNQKIYYSVHAILEYNLGNKGGTYINKVKLLGQKLYNYVYVMDKVEYTNKQNEFKDFYSSQNDNFITARMSIKNWENYISPIVLMFSPEDKMYPQENEIREKV